MRTLNHMTKSNLEAATLNHNLHNTDPKTFATFARLLAKETAMQERGTFETFDMETGEHFEVEEV